jgi:fumarylacetoacetase
MTPTVDPKLKSWVDSANDPLSDFPIQNLPLCVYRRLGARNPGALGVGIGDQILDLSSALGLERQSSWNAVMAQGPERMAEIRAQVSALLRDGAPDAKRTAGFLTAIEDCKLLLPVQIPDYTDFYASIHHATNVGKLFRPDNPLLPNYKYVPIAYHGRASSIGTNDSMIKRPRGQAKGAGDGPPRFGLSQRVDYEVELGTFIGVGNNLGEPVPLSQASEHIFGFCLLNDWSARDIQAWESQPLGPFLAKSFATTVSPWIVTLEALAPFRTAAAGDPAPLEYLNDAADQAQGAFDIQLEVWLETDKMRQTRVKPVRLSSGNFRQMYWTVAQMLAHHTSNGCNLRTGDLLGSGTVSGDTPEARGCLLELTRGGAEEIGLPSGETRRFLEDGDEIVLRGRCRREGFASIGFGECRGRIVAAG